MEPGTPRHEDSLAKRVSDFISGGLLWICCVGFLNPRGEGSAEYYTILDIEKHASHDEVKAAFRRKSLHYHPDKLRQRNETLTDDSCEAYRKIKVAYEVLSNPHRRHTYDTLGINGLMLEEEPQAFFAQPDKTQKLIKSADSWAYVILALGIALALAYVFVMPILFALQLDSEIEISWTLVFMPLWVLYGFGFLILVLGVCRGQTLRPSELGATDKWEDPDPLPKRSWSLVKFSMFVLFQAIIVAKLDDAINASWTVILLPYYAYELMGIAEALSYCFKAMNLVNDLESVAVAKAASAGEEENAEEPFGANPGFDEMAQADEHRLQAWSDAMQAIYLVFRLVQVLMVGLTVDEILGNPSWWAVLTPSMVYILVLCCAAQADNIAANFEKTGLDEMAAEGPPEDSTFRQMAEREFKQSMKTKRLALLLSRSASKCSSCICLTLYLLLLGFYLQDDGEWSFFWFYFPLVVFLGVPCLCVVCLLLCEDIDPAAYPEDVRDSAANDDIAIDIDGINRGELNSALRSAGLLDDIESAPRIHIEHSLLFVRSRKDASIAHAVVATMRKSIVEQSSTHNDEETPPFVQGRTESSGTPAIEAID